MNILVTGLCLSRNLGGAAMALTLVQELKKVFGNDLNFTFAVSAVDYDQEQYWAKYYDLRICRYAHLSTYLSHLLLTRYLTRLFTQNTDYVKNAYIFWDTTFKEFFHTVATSDVVIDLSGVSYVGDGSRGYLEGLNSFSNYYFSKKFKKPFIRFTQSYGPIKNINTFLFSAYEFQTLDMIFARGKQSFIECKRVSPKSKVQDFPDIAVLLQPERTQWTTKYLASNGIGNKYVVISPSSVAYNLKNAQTSQEDYINLFAKISSYIAQSGTQIVFLPHMYSNNKNECDIEISKKVISLLNYPNIVLINDELTPMQAKAIIAKSEYAIVSRYHALVAALSTNTKVIAVGWNIKYKDLLDYYGMQEFALDLKNQTQQSLYEQFRTLLTKLQTNSFQNSSTVKKMVYDSFELLIKLIKKNVASKNSK